MSIKLTNLKESAQYIDKARELIEKSFEYPKQFSFNIDFYPLFNEANFQHCHILIDNDEVIAHIGVKTKYLNIGSKTFKLHLYGGIAVDQSHQGKGIFKRLFNEVLNKYQDSALNILWSEKIDMYKKFQFFPAIEQFKYPPLLNQNIQIEYEQTQLNNLSSKQKDFLIQNYSNITENRLSRSEKEWEELFQIQSADIYFIKKESKLHNYFIKGKGADLTNIIHEYGFINESELKSMQNFGEVWTPSYKSTESSYETLFAALVSIGELKEFTPFIYELFGIKVESIKDDQIKFQFENDFYKTSTQDFLQGIFGPNRFKEIKAPSALFISGLDSI